MGKSINDILVDIRGSFRELLNAGEPQNDPFWEAYKDSLKYVETHKYQIALDYTYDEMDRRASDRQFEIEIKIDQILSQRGVVFDLENHEEYAKQFQVEWDRLGSDAAALSDVSLNGNPSTKTSDGPKPKREYERDLNGHSAPDASVEENSPVRDNDGPEPEL